ncbi:unnamed protein product [Ectocarpus sp. 4 AP-2014]
MLPLPSPPVPAACRLSTASSPLPGSGSRGGLASPDPVSTAPSTQKISPRFSLEEQEQQRGRRSSPTVRKRGSTTDTEYITSLAITRSKSTPLPPLLSPSSSSLPSSSLLSPRSPSTRRLLSPAPLPPPGALPLVDPPTSSARFLVRTRASSRLGRGGEEAATLESALAREARWAFPVGVGGGGGGGKHVLHAIAVRPLITRP